MVLTVKPGYSPPKNHYNVISVPRVTELTGFSPGERDWVILCGKGCLNVDSLKTL